MRRFLGIACIVAGVLMGLIVASNAAALPARVHKGDPAWLVEKKQLTNLRYAQSQSKRGAAHWRFNRKAVKWIAREHRELVYRVIGPWIPTYRCEKGTDGWQTNTGNGYYGGLQFDHDTWRSYGGLKFAYNANDATPIQQVTIAWKRLRDSDGWPNCPNP